MYQHEGVVTRTQVYAVVFTSPEMNLNLASAYFASLHQHAVFKSRFAIKPEISNKNRHIETENHAAHAPMLRYIRSSLDSRLQMPTYLDSKLR